MNGDEAILIRREAKRCLRFVTKENIREKGLYESDSQKEMVSGYRICDPMAVGHDFHQSSSCSLQGIIFFTLEDRNRDSFTDTIIGLYVLS